MTIVVHLSRPIRSGFFTAIRERGYYDVIKKDEDLIVFKDYRTKKSKYGVAGSISCTIEELLEGDFVDDPFKEWVIFNLDLLA